MITEEQFIKMKSYPRIVEKNENQHKLYKDSKFLPLKTLGSKSKGAEIERIFQEKWEEDGWKVLKSENSDHDRIIESGSDEDNDFINLKAEVENSKTRRKIEIKGSFLWNKKNTFRWQQIRPDQDYDEIVFVAIYPDCIRFYRSSKEVVCKNLVFQDENGNWPHMQHGGQGSESRCFWLEGLPEDYPWMVEVE